MTGYAWTADQRRQLGPGCTVVVDGKRQEVARGPGARASDGAFAFDCDRRVCAVEADPSTLRPPTLAWLRKEAKRKLGKKATVERGIGRVHVSVDVAPIATFSGNYGSGVPAETLCARFLDALPEVER